MFGRADKMSFFIPPDQLQEYQTLGCRGMLRWMHKSFENERDVAGSLR